MIKVGQKLREERLRRELSLQDVEKGTKIKSSFLSSIEKGEYFSLPSLSYAQGFVRNYILFLELPEREMMALFRREFDEKTIPEVLPKGFSTRRNVTSKRFRFPYISLPFVLVFLALIGYLSFQYRYLVVNPPLTVVSPKEGGVYSSDVIVSGISDTNATVFVNSDAVALSSDGKFEKKVSEFPGKTVILIKAVNRLGKETLVKRIITVQ